jgi:L-asparagine oxygenase
MYTYPQKNEKDSRDVGPGPAVIKLSKSDNKTLLDLCIHISASPSKNPDLFCKQAKMCSAYLPSEIKNVLHEFKTNGSETGFLLIRGAPLGQIPDTPTTNNQKRGEATILAKIQAIFVQYISEMVAYEAEGYGRLFQDIVPVKEMSDKQVSLGNSELEIHTEQAFSELRPDILSLACLRGDVNAKTYILPIGSVLEHLPTEDIEILKEPLWKTGVDLSFKMNGVEFIEGDVRGPFPIVSQDYTFRFDQDLMKGITDDSDAFIKKIVDIYYAHRCEHCLEPGDVVLVDNNRAVHGRSGYNPKYDGKDRFLIRCFSTFDLEKSKYARVNGGRTISSIYS